MVHKGPDFGQSSQTVVVDARYMSNAWSPRGQVQHHNPASAPVHLGDLVKNGGKDYNLLCNNCIHGSNRMQDRFRQGK